MEGESLSGKRSSKRDQTRKVELRRNDIGRISNGTPSSRSSDIWSRCTLGLDSKLHTTVLRCIPNSKYDPTAWGDEDHSSVTVLRTRYVENRDRWRGAREPLASIALVPNVFPAEAPHLLEFPSLQASSSITRTPRKGVRVGELVSNGVEEGNSGAGKRHALGTRRPCVTGAGMVSSGLATRSVCKALEF